MSTFSKTFSYPLADYDLAYHHPEASDPTATVTIRTKTTSENVVTFNILGQKLGLAIEDGNLVLGLANHGEDLEIIHVDFSNNPANCSFSLGTNPANARMGGIGLEDLRDASIVWRRKYFYLETEPINVYVSTTTGEFNVEIRDRSTKTEAESAWFEIVDELA